MFLGGKVRDRLDVLVRQPLQPFKRVFSGRVAKRVRNDANLDAFRRTLLTLLNT